MACNENDKAWRASALPFFTPEKVMQVQPSIVVSVRDGRRLEALLSGRAGEGSLVAEALQQELDRADWREPDEIPADVVTMNSRVLCVDETTGAERELRLVYPPDADAAHGAVSILAPVGAALLGLSVGQSIDWPLPGGRTTRLRVSAVLYQPEASGLPE